MTLVVTSFGKDVSDIGDIIFMKEEPDIGGVLKGPREVF